jgi:hypothetical protein
MIPEVLHAPRSSIGSPGPGAPLGGGTPGSTFGLVMASAGGHVHTMAAAQTAKVAVRRTDPARIID